jgi:hypothetical protein
MLTTIRSLLQISRKTLLHNLWFVCISSGSTLGMHHAKLQGGAQGGVQGGAGTNLKDVQEVKLVCLKKVFESETHF